MPELTYIVAIEQDSRGDYSATVYPADDGPDTGSTIDHSVSPSIIEARAYMRDGVDAPDPWTFELTRIMLGV